MSDTPTLIMVRTHPDKPSGEVCDLDTLRSWARSGRISREQQIFDPQQQLWVPAYQFGPISAIFTQQLWDAWEDEDEFKATASAEEAPQPKAAPQSFKSKPESNPVRPTKSREKASEVEIELNLDASLDKPTSPSPPQKTKVQKNQVEVEPELEPSKEEDPIADVLAMFDEHSAAEAEAVRQHMAPKPKNLPLPPKVESQRPIRRQKTDIEELPMSALEPLTHKPFVSQKPQKTPRTPRPQPKRQVSKTNRTKVPAKGPRVRPQSGPNFSMDHADAFRLPLTAQSFPTRRPPARRSGVRWGRILMIIAPFAMIFLVIRWYVGATATAQFPTGEQLDQTISPSGFADVPLSAESDPFFDLDTELRSQIRPACLSITPETLVEDVMTVELDAFDIDVVGIRASIVEWTGRKLDRPRTGTFRFRVKGDDSYEYQLAAIALVIGKYMENYVMDVAKLEVTIDTTQKSLQFELDPDLVARYYRQNIELKQLFGSVQ